MEKTVKNMLQCLRNVICGENVPLAAMSEAEQEKFYKMSLAQDIAHLISSTVRKNEKNIISEKYKKQFRQQENLAIYRYTCQDLALEEIRSVFEQQQISFLPLKGAVIRESYPEAWMRTSSDIDILIREEDYERAKNLLIEECGFLYESKDKKNANFYRDEYVHLELHFNLIKDRQTVEFSPEYIWKNVERDGYECRMSDADFYAFHIEHMKQHFMTGGCGIRFFLDLWILNHFEKDRKEEQRKEKLGRCGLTAFEEAVRSLSEVWFGREEHTELTRQVEKFILAGGSVYGSVENWALVQGVHNQGKLKSVVRRIWLPYEELCWSYPALEGRRYVQPYYEAKRFFKMILDGHWHRSVRELKANAKGKELSDVESMMKRLGLR